MSEQRYDMVDMADDACAFKFAFGKGALKYIYKVSSLDALKDSLDAFNYERLLQRTEYFVYEHDKLSEHIKQEFYLDLKNNKQNQNFVYEFFEKLRTTPYDLNAQIIARLSVEFIKNKGLTYYESTLLTNINLFNNRDWQTAYDNFQEVFEDKNYDNSVLLQTKRYSFKISCYEDLSTYNKLMQLGIIFNTNDIDGGTFENHLKNPVIPESKLYYVCNITNIFYQVLKDVIKIK